MNSFGFQGGMQPPMPAPAAVPQQPPPVPLGGAQDPQSQYLAAILAQAQKPPTPTTGQAAGDDLLAQALMQAGKMAGAAGGQGQPGQPFNASSGGTNANGILQPGGAAGFQPLPNGLMTLGGG